MLFKTNVIINIILSSLFIILGFYGLTQENEFADDAVVTLVFIFGTFPLYLIYDMLCLRMSKYNQNNRSITAKAKTAGIVLTSIIALLSIAALFLAIMMYVAYADKPYIKEADTWPYIMLLMWSIIAVSISSLLNIIFFIILLRKNKQLYTDDVEAIGTDND